MEGSDIHTWMDEPVKVYGSAHRVFRHISEWIPKVFFDKYGEDLARNIMLDHIIYDKSNVDHKTTEQNLFIRKILPWIRPEDENLPGIATQINLLENIRTELGMRIESLKNASLVVCPKCSSIFAVKRGFGVVRPGIKKQRRQCRDCGKTFYQEEVGEEKEK